MSEGHYIQILEVNMISCNIKHLKIFRIYSINILFFIVLSMLLPFSAFSLNDSNSVKYSILRDHIWDIYCFSFSSDGKYIISGDVGGQIIIWDAITQKKISEYFVQKYLGYGSLGIRVEKNSKIEYVKILPDNKTFVSISCELESYLRVWDIKSGKVLRKYKLDHHYPFNRSHLPVSPNGKFFMDANNLRYLENGRIVKSLDKKKSYKYNFSAFTPDSKTVVISYISNKHKSNEKNNLIFWDLNKFKILRKFIFNNPYVELSFSQDSSKFIYQEYNKSAKNYEYYLYNIGTGKSTKMFERNIFTSPSNAFLPDRNTVILIEIKPKINKLFYLLFDINTSSEVTLFSLNQGYIGMVDKSNIVFSPDGKYFISNPKVDSLGKRDLLFYGTYPFSKSFDIDINRDYNKLLENKSNYKEYKHFICKYKSAFSPNHKKIVMNAYDSFLKLINNGSCYEIAECFHDFANEFFHNDNGNNILSSLFFEKLSKVEDIDIYHKIFKILPNNQKILNYATTYYVKALVTKEPITIARSYKKYSKTILSDKKHIKTISSILSKKLIERNVLESFYNVLNIVPKNSNISYEVLHTLINQVLPQKNSETIARCYNDFIKDFITKDEDFEIVSSTLINILINENKLERFHKTLQILPENHNITILVASEYVRAIYEQIIQPAKELSPTIQFLDDFTDAPGDIIQKAFNDGVELETELCVNQHDELVEKEMGLFKSLFNDPDHSPQVPDGSPEDIVREKLARQLFIEAVQAKEEGNNHLFLIKYRVVTRNPFFKQTEAAFNLYRDKEMKLFFFKNNLKNWKIIIEKQQLN